MTGSRSEASPRPPEGYDVVVVGGGPAGSTAARLLAQCGHRVLVLTRDRPARTAIAESLPPSCRRLYRHLGIESAVDGAGFQATTGNTVWWGDDEARIERFPGHQTGHQVSSTHLERLLLQLAVAEGAEVRRDRTVREVRGIEDDGNRSPGGATPTVRADGEHGEIAARWLLDASGRAGVIGRRWRQRVTGAATLALTARFESSTWNLEDPTHTLVESYDDGWAWSVPLSPTERFAAVMVDPRRTELSPPSDREALFRAELAKTSHLHRLLDRAQRVGAARACDASCYTATSFCGPGFFLLGDAGSFIDPLSSYGVKKAMTSGWLAAVCVHTCLLRPALEPHALALYQRRELAVFESYARLSASYSRLAGERHASGFWAARASLDADRGLTSSELDPSRLRDDPAVRSSFEQLRRSDRLQLEHGHEVEIAMRPMVAGNEIVLAEHVICPWAPDGVRYLRDVELTRLASLAPAARTVPDLLEAYNHGGSPAALPDLLASLAVCLAKGILRASPGSLTLSAGD